MSTTWIVCDFVFKALMALVVVAALWRVGRVEDELRELDVRLVKVENDPDDGC